MKKRILFVCLGNICRSPSAEAVFRGLVEKENLQQQIECDSAGILDYHEGEPADRRMQLHAAKRGYRLTSVSRPIKPQLDFDRFDYIIGMDDNNILDLQRLARNPSDLAKIHRMTDFSSSGKYHAVPDPYYGGDEGFELVLDLLEDACQGLLDEIKK